MPMDINRQKEQFSIAYIRTIVAAAGCKIRNEEVDDDSIDFDIVGYRDSEMRQTPKIAVQLKCTINNQNAYYLAKEDIPFRLKQKNYNDLAREDSIQAILVVLIVPEDPKDWVSQDELGLKLHNAAYWLSLSGRSPTDQKTEQVYLPRTNLFTVNALKQMMHDAGYRR
ncbi:MAG: DUF4365 domain-containing protein [Phototrophicaceae bacterium]|jgi:hypothetical protein